MTVARGPLASLEAKPGKGVDGRQAHLDGQIPAALGQVAPNLHAGDTDIRTVDILAAR